MQPVEVFSGEFEGKAKEMRELKVQRKLYTGLCGLIGLTEIAFFVFIPLLLAYYSLRIVNDSVKIKGGYALWLILVVHIPVAFISVFMGHKLSLLLGYFYYSWFPDVPGNPREKPMVSIQVRMHAHICLRAWAYRMCAVAYVQ
jgi:hypothetical protein